MTKLLFILLFLFGCQSFGVFKHSHGGACVDIDVSGNSIYYICYYHESEIKCYQRFNGSNDVSFFFVGDSSCEEFCDTVSEECVAND